MIGRNMYNRKRSKCSIVLIYYFFPAFPFEHFHVWSLSLAAEPGAFGKLISAAFAFVPLWSAFVIPSTGMMEEVDFTIEAQNIRDFQKCV